MSEAGSEQERDSLEREPLEREPIGHVAIGREAPGREPLEHEALECAPLEREAPEGEALEPEAQEGETLARLKGIAAGIFARRGVDFATARRAGGWTNVTWLAGGLALRIATEEGRENIRREARLAALLPPEVGYPVSLECGVTDGFEWNLSQEIPGVCLGEAWDSLSWAERAAALGQLWARAQAVHRVNLTAAVGLARTRAWYNSTDAAEAEAALARLEGQGLFSAAQAANLRDDLGRFWVALPAGEWVLNHGDLTVDNALWRQGRVVSLLDFEFAVTAPVELDLNALVKVAFEPEAAGAPAAAGGPEDDNALEAEAQVGRALRRQAAAEAAAPLLARPGSRERLLGYAILLDLWKLETWLAHPEGEGPLEQWDPYRRLLSLADGRGGYLKALVA